MSAEEEGGMAGMVGGHLPVPEVRTEDEMVAWINRATGGEKGTAAGMVVSTGARPDGGKVAMIPTETLASLASKRVGLAERELRRWQHVYEAIGRGALGGLTVRDVRELLG